MGRDTQEPGAVGYQTNPISQRSQQVDPLENEKGARTMVLTPLIWSQRGDSNSRPADYEADSEQPKNHTSSYLVQ